MDIAGDHKNDDMQKTGRTLHDGGNFGSRSHRRDGSSSSTIGGELDG